MQLTVTGATPPAAVGESNVTATVVPVVEVVTFAGHAIESGGAVAGGGAGTVGATGVGVVGLLGPEHAAASSSVMAHALSSRRVATSRREVFFGIRSKDRFYYHRRAGPVVDAPVIGRKTHNTQG